MTKSKYVKILAVGAVVAGLMAPSASTAYPTVAGAAEGSQYEHTSRTYPATGTFRCGDLVLRVTKGTETEVQDGYLNNGVTRVAIARTWRGVVLAGSDGRRYRASGGTVAWFVLEAPDDENPVSGLEVIQVFFRRGPNSSPGWLREVIRIRHGHETDAVSGPCNFG